MADGSIDILIQKLAIENVAKANTALEKTLELILSVNKASRGGKGGSTPNDAEKINKANKASTERLKLADQTLVMQKKLVQSEINLKNALSQENKEIAKNRFETQQANKTIKEAAILSSKLSTEYQKQTVKLNQLIRKRQDLAIKQELGVKLTKKETTELKRLTSQITRKDTALKKVDAQVGRNFRHIGDYKRSLLGAAGAARSLASAMGLVGGAFLIVGVMRDAIKTIVEFNKQLIAVGKTTDLAGADLKMFGRQIVTLGLELKGISTINLLKTAEVAGQLGVRGSRNILKFSETIEKLALTSDIAGQESARAFAKFIELSDDSVENADRLGSVITELGNNFATTESEILKNSKEIQRGVIIYDTAAHKILALGAATSALGGQAEASRGAFQKVFKVLNEGAVTGANLEKILKLTGQTAEEFREEFGRDSVEVFRKFVKGLSESDKAGNSLTVTLGELGLAEKRTEALVGSLAKNYNVLEDALNRANSEYENNIALNKEYNLAAESLSSNIDDLGDAWDNLVLSVEKGDGAISKFFKNAVTEFTAFIQNINKANETYEDKLTIARQRGITERHKLFKRNLEVENELAKENGEEEITILQQVEFERKKIIKEKNALNFEGLEIDKNRLAFLEEKDNWDSKEKQNLRISIAKGKAEKLKAFYLEGQLDALEEIEKLSVDGEGSGGSGDTDKKTSKFIKFKEMERVALEGSIELLEEIIALNNQSIRQADNAEERQKLTEENRLLQIKIDKIKEIDLLAVNVGKFERGELTLTDPRGGFAGEELDDDSDIVKAGEDRLKEIELEEELKQQQIDLAFELGDALTGLGNALFDSKIAKIDAEIRAEEDKYAILFALAEGDAEQQRLLAIEREENLQKLEKKRRKEQKKQAIFNKAQALINIAINTAVAVTKVTAEAALAAPLLIPLIIASGAAQAATVLATPIPQFAKGGTMDKDGLAVVGDGGRKEVIKNPDGTIQVTPDKSTVVGLEKGAEIFPSIEAFNLDTPTDITDKIYNASIMASLSINNNKINGYLESQKVFNDKLLDAMVKNTQAIKKQKLRATSQRIDIADELYKMKYD